MSNDWVGVEHEVVVGVYINAINIFCSTTDNYLRGRRHREEFHKRRFQNKKNLQIFRHWLNLYFHIKRLSLARLPTPLYSANVWISAFFYFETFPYAFVNRNHYCVIAYSSSIVFPMSFKSFQSQCLQTLHHPVLGKQFSLIRQRSAIVSSSVPSR